MMITKDLEYERRIKAYRSDFWYGLIIVLCGIALDISGIKWAACFAAFIFLCFLIYGIYKTWKFYNWFKNYWLAKGLDKKEISQKWRKLFPPIH
jgi:hypothetical protein